MKSAHWLTLEEWTGEVVKWLCLGLDPEHPTMPVSSSDPVAEGRWANEVGAVESAIRKAVRLGLLKELAGVNVHTDIEKFRFQRDDAIRWAAPRYPEKFPFQADAVTKAHRWPWGDYETQKLRDLADAVREFWLDYDPDSPDPRFKSPPKRQDVVDWFRGRDWSGHLAGAAAAIIASDRAPPGRPRQVDPDGK